MPRSESAKLWRERLRRFASSNRTVAQFCLAEDVSQAAYYYWKRKLGNSVSNAQPKPSTPEFRFVPLRLPAQPASPLVQIGEPPAAPTLACTTIELPGGVRIRVETPTGLPPSQAADQHADRPAGQHASRPREGQR